MVKSSRSLLERATDIFQLLAKNSDIYTDDKIPKSAFQEVGISPGNIDQWLELIKYIQEQPRLRITKSGKKTYVEQLDSKFMLYLRKQYLDASLTYLERHTAITMYLKLLTNAEKVKGDEIDWETLIDDPPELLRPTVYKLVEAGRYDRMDS